MQETNKVLKGLNSCTGIRGCRNKFYDKTEYDCQVCKIQKRVYRNSRKRVKR